MLEDAEKRVADLEALHRIPATSKNIAYLPSVVEACLRDLKATFETDPDHARALLGRLIGQITLRREGTRLIADLQGDLAGLLEMVLEMEDQVGKPGAGRGILFERQHGYGWPRSSAPERVRVIGQEPRTTRLLHQPPSILRTSESVGAGA